MESSTLRTPNPDDHASGRSLRIPIRPEAVVRARTTVRQAATDAGLSEDRIDDLVIAVSEACTNAIEAEIAAGETREIEIACALEDDIFEVRVTDKGSGFDPSALAARPPLTDPGHLDLERGWGIQLMRELVDDVIYDLTGSGTTVCLRIAR